MRESFRVVQPWVLAHEGGYVNHPKDPGGATNMGVTQRTYDAWRELRGLPRRAVRNITEPEVEEIYRVQYWNTVQGDRLPWGLDYAVYDYAINSGPARAARELQRMMGVPADGIIGEITLAAIRSRNVQVLIDGLCGRRMAFLRSLKHWGTFQRGWTRRVIGRHEGAQDDDEGVIDRATVLGRKTVAAEEVAPPKRLEDGAGRKAFETERNAIGLGIAALAAFLAFRSNRG